MVNKISNHAVLEDAEKMGVGGGESWVGMAAVRNGCLYKYMKDTEGVAVWASGRK